MKQTVLTLIAGLTLMSFKVQALNTDYIGKIQVPNSEKNNNNGQWFLNIFNTDYNELSLNMVYEFFNSEREDYTYPGDQTQIRRMTNKSIKKITGYGWRQIDSYPEVKQAVTEQLQKREEVLYRGKEVQEEKNSNFLTAIFESAIPVKKALNNTLSDIDKIQYCSRYGELDAELCSEEGDESALM